MIQVKEKRENGESGIGALIGTALLIVIIALGIVWIAQGNDFFMYKVFAPKYEQVRHETFKQSQSYNDGMLQQLRKSQLDYQKASEEHKSAIGSVILHQYASYDREKLPDDLKRFLEELQRKQTLE